MDKVNIYKLYHSGIKGQKWGVRRFQNKDGTLTPEGKKRYADDDSSTGESSGDKKPNQTNYKSASIGAAMARSQNTKVDAGFKRWKESDKNRDEAIELGKKRNELLLAYEKDKQNKTLKAEFDAADKLYKKKLGENTTYRKGVVRQDVGSDLSRKYLSEAKKVKKQLDSDPTNKDLQKQYNDLMSKHDVERAKARKAVSVAKKRSDTKASIKRTLTNTLKAVIGTAAVGVGLFVVNKILEKNNVTINGKKMYVSGQDVSNLGKIFKAGKTVSEYMY